MNEINEEQFLERFRDLLLSFPNLLKSESSTSIRVEGLNNLRQNLDSLSPVPNARPNQSVPLLQTRIEEFIDTISNTKFDNKLIPYDKITEFVFIETPEELYFEFTTRLKTYGKQYFQRLSEVSATVTSGETETETETETNLDSEQTSINASDCEKDFYRIVRHIDLALIQITKFASTKIEHLQSEYDNLKDQYLQLNTQLTNLKNEAELQYKNMLTQFISILGIFAAILMGAFGAIQGFSNIFANANEIPLGKLLIISSIGASSVLLILFFLLNGIAKLTDRSLSSTKIENSSILKKHPTLVISHGILISITLIGAALILSNTVLKIAWQGIWWLMPALWIVYFIHAIKKANKSVNNATSETSTVSNETINDQQS